MSASGVRRPAESICCNCAGRMAFAVRAVGAERVRRLGRYCCGVVTVDIKPRVTAGTIFQDTRTSLRLWFQAMWWVTCQKNGVSALGLQRVLGLKSYETAWT